MIDYGLDMPFPLRGRAPFFKGMEIACAHFIATSNVIFLHTGYRNLNVVLGYVHGCTKWHGPYTLVFLLQKKCGDWADHLFSAGVEFFKVFSFIF